MLVRVPSASTPSIVCRPSFSRAGFGGGANWGEEEGGDTYTVKSGDTLSKIGQHHGVAWRDIHEANRDVIGDNPDLIKPGQKLRIPKK